MDGTGALPDGMQSLFEEAEARYFLDAPGREPVEPAKPDPNKPNTGRSTRGWSYYGKASSCLRSWAFQELFPDPMAPPGGARGIGTLWHALLARHYLLAMGRPQPSIEEVAEQTAIEAGVNRLDDRGDPVPMMIDRYRHYVAQFATCRWTPILVEEELMVGFLPDPDTGKVHIVDAYTPGSVLYTSRFDLAVRDEHGKVWIVDHKTTYEIKKSTSYAYGMHGQFLGFWHLGWHHYGDDFAGPLINYCQTWCGTRFKRERPPAAPALVETFPMNVVMHAMQIDTWKKTTERIAAAQGRLPVAHDWPAATHELVCTHKYGGCDHAVRCRFGS